MRADAGSGAEREVLWAGSELGWPIGVDVWGHRLAGG